MILTKGKTGIGANKGYRLRIEDGGAPLFTVTGDTETDLNSGKTLPKVIVLADAKKRQRWACFRRFWSLACDCDYPSLRFI